jgi:putative restriction endonuclease
VADRNFVGIRPDLISDPAASARRGCGPILLHGLQEMKGVRLTILRSRHAHPDKARLEERYEKFRAAG